MSCLCRVSMSATMPLEVIAHLSVSLVVLEWSLDKILYPSEILVSAAIKQKSLPAMAKCWLSLFYNLTYSCTLVINIRIELTLCMFSLILCMMVRLFNHLFWVWYLSLLKCLFEYVNVCVVLKIHTSLI